MRFFAPWFHRRRRAKVTKLLDELHIAHVIYQRENWFASTQYKDIKRRLDDAFSAFDQGIFGS